VAQCLVDLDPEGTARLLGASLGLRETHGIGGRPIDTDTVARARETVEARIGAETVRSLVESTGKLTVGEAADLARALIRDHFLET
jgi:hypothetical protein